MKVDRKDHTELLKISFTEHIRELILSLARFHGMEEVEKSY